MSKHRPLARGDVLPASFLAAQQEFMSTATTPTLVLSKASATSVQIVAGAGDAQVSVGIMGKWRYNTATVTASHPGGAAGLYDVYVTASDNSFSDSPTPDTDNTNYAFGLVIRATGSPPATALYRKIGQVTWNGSAIVAVVDFTNITTPVPRIPIASLASMSSTALPDPPRNEVDVVVQEPTTAPTQNTQSTVFPNVWRFAYNPNAQASQAKWEYKGGGRPLQTSFYNNFPAAQQVSRTTGTLDIPRAGYWLIDVWWTFFPNTNQNSSPIQIVGTLNFPGDENYLQRYHSNYYPAQLGTAQYTTQYAPAVVFIDRVSTLTSTLGVSAAPVTAGFDHGIAQQINATPIALI